MQRLIRRVTSGWSSFRLRWNMVSFGVFRSLFLILMSASTTASFATQQNMVPQSITISIAPITVLAVSGNPQPFLLTKYDSSSPPFFRDRTTSYSLTTNEKNVVLQAKIDAPLPPGVHLTISAEPSLGIGMGGQELTGALNPVDLVIGIGPGLENDRVLYYDVYFDDTFTHVGVFERKVTVSLCVSDLSRCSEKSQKIVLGSDLP